MARVWVQLVLVTLIVGAGHLVGATPAHAAAEPRNTASAYGDAADHGPYQDMEFAAPLEGITATASGDGYWLVASDGGVFAYGDAAFHGSAGAIQLNQPIVGIAATASGDGYWLVASDGGVFAYGGADYHDSMGGKDLPAPITAIAADPEGDGYWLAGRDGEVYEFGTQDFGSAAEEDTGPQAPTVAMAAHPTGKGYWLLHGERLFFEVKDSGPAVRRLQERLRELGYWVGPIDGVFGSLTEQAVYAFQKYEGLQTTGEVDEPTRQALGAATPARPRSTSGSLIEVDKTDQLVFIVRDGGTLWVFNTSTGTEEPYTYEGREYMADTPPGRWQIFRQVDGYRESNLGRLYRPKYFHEDGIALHGYSFVPPYPASHGCVRVTNAAIDYIWENDLAPIGTEVWVYGTTPET